MRELAGKRVLIMAGGTGGHVVPGLAVAERLRDGGATVEWLGTRAGIESRLVPAANFPIHFINVSGLRGKGLGRVVSAPFMLMRALWEAYGVVRQFRPDCVLGMGGFASGPGGLSAFLAGYPVLIHEQNAIAGTTNRLLARIAKRVLQAFPSAFPAIEKVETVGNPVRSTILTVAPKCENDSGDFHLLVLGGSLGAKAINDVLPEVVSGLLKNYSVKVLHQCGSAHFSSVERLYADKKLTVDVRAYIDDMAAAYAWADVIVCRAGALTVSEIAAAGRPAIFIPFPQAIDDHQTRNAEWLVKKNAAILLPQNELNVHTLREKLEELFAQPQRLFDMSRRARSEAKTDATELVVRSCVEVMGG